MLPPGPGLELSADQWNIAQGGTGFAPPYAFPGKNLLAAAASETPASTNCNSGTNATPATAASTVPTTCTSGSPNSPRSDRVEIYLRDNAQPFETNQAAIDKYIKTFATRYPRPAAVFCSRELEAGLLAHVKTDMARGLGFPSDDALRARARSLVGCEQTPADDPVLLEKFKTWALAQQAQEPTSPAPTTSALPSEMKMDLTDAEMDSILADMSFDMDPMDTADIAPVTTPEHVSYLAGLSRMPRRISPPRGASFQR